MSSIEFNYTGGAQSWTVPTGISQIIVETWGASSALSVHGGYRRVMCNVSAGNVLTVLVGGTNGYPDAGTGNLGNGAGSTSVSFGTAKLCVAGGAGGGRPYGNGSAPYPLGGAGGDTTGQDGAASANGGTATPGLGGTQTVGGNGGSGTTPGNPGTLGAGGNSTGFGGGGGYFGGGGGGYSTTTSNGTTVPQPAGGGGGSNGGTGTVLADQRNVATPNSGNPYAGFARISWDTSFTASADPTNAPPRTQLAITNLAGTTATVVRIDAAGNRSFVRSAHPATLSNGSWVGFDTEAPYGQPVTYMATSNTGTTATTANSVTVDPRAPWLVHPGVPSFSVAVPGVLMPQDEDDDINQQYHVVLNRADPIAINDGVRHTSTFEVIVRTDTKTEADAMTRILADGSALLLQVAYDWTDETEYRWISVAASKKTRRTMNFGDPSRNFTLTCTEVTAPGGLQQAQWTWNGVSASYATWDAVTAAFPTWNDLTLNNPTT